MSERRRGDLPLRITSRVFWDLGLWMGGFGALVGIVFPLFCLLMGVPRAIALSTTFRAACIAAGLAVGGVNLALARGVVGARIRLLAQRMTSVAERVRESVYSSDWAGCGADCMISIDSDDEMGEVAEAFNELISAVERFRRAHEAVAGVSRTLGRHLALGELAQECLDDLARYSGADTALLLASVEEGGLEVVARIGDDDLPSAEALVREARRGALVRLPNGEGELLILAIEANDQLMGAAVLLRRRPFEQDVEQLLRTLRPALGVALSNADSHAQLHRLATEDSLTGLWNRRHALELAEQAYGDALRSGRSMGLLLFDVDRFKWVNDRHGHASGDAVLRTIAETSRSCVREGDIVARYGGEEFLVVLPGADMDQVMKVGERIRAQVSKTPTLLPSGLLEVTVSLGAAVLPSPGIDDLDDLLRAADDALYASKEAGRNTLRSA